MPLLLPGGVDGIKPSPAAASRLPLDTLPAPMLSADPVRLGSGAPCGALVSIFSEVALWVVGRDAGVYRRGTIAGGSGRSGHEADLRVI